MSDKPKVTAHLDKPVTTIDADTGDVTVTRKGQLKGFGKGFQDYLRGSIDHVEIEGNVGQFPEGHPREGKWAVQIMLSYCETKEQADALCDKAVPIVQKALRTPAAPPLALPKGFTKQ